jgi:hypothetical protein
MSIFKTSRNLLADELDALLRKSLKCAMLSRGINEEELAAELTKRLGRTDNPVTPGLVNAWKAETKHRWHLPANLVPIICEILGDDTIQRLLLSEKLRQSLELGKSTDKVVSLLRSALPKATERTKGEGRDKPQRSPKRSRKA